MFYRYAGLSEENEPPTLIRELVPPSMVERARVLGAAFRVAHLISAARPGVLLVLTGADLLFLGSVVAGARGDGRVDVQPLAS